MGGGGGEGGPAEVSPREEAALGCEEVGGCSKDRWE